MTGERNGWVRPRPLRVAFLVEESEECALVLDGIFAGCYGLWGGRFNLIVPCIEKRISPNYWPWLEKYCPDIVYSYVEQSRDDVLEIHERIAPLDYKLHRQTERLDVFGLMPSFDFAPLSSLSNVFKLARLTPPAQKGPPVKIIDSLYIDPPSRLLSDNFGTYSRSRGNSHFPPDALSVATLLTVVSPERHGDRYFGISPNLLTVPDEVAAFTEFSARRATAMSLLSAQFAPRLEFSDFQWKDSLNLVLGESFHDRILFWNARLLTPTYLDGDLCCLRVTIDKLREPEFLNTIGSLIRERNHFGRSSSDITIRSVSASAKEIEEARALLRSTKPWGSVRIAPLSGTGSIVPSLSTLEQANEIAVDSQFFRSVTWKEFNWQSETARPPAVIPDHLADAPPKHIFSEGYWCADHLFESSGVALRAGCDNVWALPSRWRMSGAFNHKLLGSSGPTGWSARGWRSRGGSLAVLVSIARPIDFIEIPPASQAFSYALCSDGAWPASDRVHPTNKVGWVRPSNEARYLTGVLGMTGGLVGAEAFLLHPFLMDVFESLGGSPNLPAEKLMPTASRLQKKARLQRAFDLSADRERKALAELIVKASRSIKKPIDYISYEVLKQKWKEYRAAYWAKNPQQVIPDDEFDWDAHEAETLDACFTEMRRRKIVFQGHQWTCSECHHKNWIDFSQLSAQLTCDICQTVEPAPIEFKWLFRPNEFLIESLRDHSALSLIWALSALRNRSRHSFIFKEPSALGFDPDAIDADAEVDLLVLQDGKAILCEVKSSWRGLRSSDISSFIDMATRLRPDIALLAVMDIDGGPQNDLAMARASLSNANIKFEVMTLRDHRPEDDPYLSSN